MASLHERVNELEEQTGVTSSAVAGLSLVLTEVRKDVSGMRSELVSLRADVIGLRGDVAELRRDMNQRFLAVDQKFMWLQGTQTAMLVAIIGALVGSFYR